MYYGNSPEIKSIALKAFPSYSGKKFRVETFRGPMNLSSYWSDGSKSSYVIVNMANDKAKAVPDSGAIQTGKPFQMTTLPDGMAVVEHSISRGIDMGITIYVNAENLSKMLPAPNETTWAEKVVLSATRGLKSSYGGIKDYRFREALSQTGITKAEWDAAKESLIQKKMLNKAGAIQNSGRNAIGMTNLYQLKRENSVDNSS